MRVQQWQQQPREVLPQQQLLWPPGAQQVAVVELVEVVVESARLVVVR
jgi:hypothetical protein